MVDHPSKKPVIIPADVPGSWEVMLAIYERLARTHQLFTWDSDDDYNRRKAQKSEPMALLLSQLGNLPVRQSFRVGKGPYGVGLMLPFDETGELRDSRMVTINITERRRFEICLIDVGGLGLKRPIIERTECDLEDAAEQVVRFANLLPGTKIRNLRGSSISSFL